MGTVDFRNYLNLLRDLSKTLEQLTEIEQWKTQAVQNDDLNDLNECMKQEQVISLKLRGYESKQQAALAALNLTAVPLGRLIEFAPDECVQETRAVVEELRTRYELFHGAFEIAQNTLEINLHQVEAILMDLGANQNSGPGYSEAGPELPKSMRTDFRA